MTVREALRWAADAIKRSNVQFADTPILDASVLLAFAMGVTREKILASYPDEVPNEALIAYRNCIAQRCTGIPVSYIRRMKEFYGLPFYVDKGVLVPRPETETLVETALGIIAQDTGVKRIIDVGTGSGCVAIAIKKCMPHIEMLATDISLDAERVFTINCDTILGLRIPFIRTSLLTGVSGEFDMIVSNPPYLTDEAVDRMKEAGWPEPECALAGGKDGLDLVRELITAALRILKTGGYILLEADPDQMEAIEAFLLSRGFTDIVEVCDLAGRKRVITGRVS